MTKRTYGKDTKSRRGIKGRLFPRDYEVAEGRWGSASDPYEGKREEGRDRWIRCYYCGEYVVVAGACVSHIIALTEGGENDIDNLVLAHVECDSWENLERSKQQV